MKQIFKSNLGIKVEEVPVPVLQANFVLVKVFKSLISTGTETSSMRLTNRSINEKLLNSQKALNKVNKIVKEEGFSEAVNKVRKKLSSDNEIEKAVAAGYSCAGEVVAVTSNCSEFSVGDRVACAGAGFASHAEYVSVPLNLVTKIPVDVSYEDAAFTTVGCIAMHGLRRADLKFGDFVVIVGLGLIGLIAVQLAHSVGLKVIGVDLIDEKIKLAKKFGANMVFNGKDSDLSMKINKFTSGMGADAVLLFAASKSNEIINNSMHYCKKRGKVIIVGDVGLSIEREEFYKKEIDVLMSTSYGFGRYDENYELSGHDYPAHFVKWTINRNMKEFLYLLSNQRINLSLLKSKEFDVDQAKEAYEYLVSNPEVAIGVLLSYNSESDDLKNNSKLMDQVKQRIQLEPSQFKVSSGIVRVAFIGAGGFVKRTHLPNIYNLKKSYQIKAICDTDNANLLVLSKKYNPEYVTTDYKTILEDSDVDMVVIGTRHHTHGLLVLEALKAKKHVLVEKPLTLNQTELDKIISVAKSGECYLTVGFNRRFSPLSKKLKEELSRIDVLENNNFPIHALYRVNAGNISKESWVQDVKIGGGRIVGEICHFIDYMSFLVGSEPISYQYCVIPESINVENTDSLSISLQFADGSIGTIIYVTQGSKLLTKEYIEVHSGSSSFIMRDFKVLEKYSGTTSTIKLKKADKGWASEVAVFADTIKGVETNSIRLDSLYQTSKIAIEIQDDINDKSL